LNKQTRSIDTVMVSAEKTLPKKGERNILITSALPYVNNVPHLGNIIGSVLSADVYSRYSKARGRPTLFVCGTDEYGTATETKALEEKVSPRELCDKYAAVHKEIYDWFELDFDIFGRTSTAAQEQIVQSIFRRLYKNGYTSEATSRQPYCEQHKSFLADRYIEGTCPKCGYDDARGDQCDKCGSVDYEPLDLKNARCKVDGATPVPRETKHIHLLLDKLQPQIDAWVKESSEKGQWSRNGKNITESWLKTGLRDRGITRDLKWGVPVPLDIFDKEEDKAVYRDKVFYVWFDACIGYVSITANYTDEWEKWWRDPENVQLYQFMGKDNVPFHTVIFPGSQMGTEDKWTKLHHLSTTEYLNYENGKFSKSRGIGVFGNTAKDIGIPADVWRYYLIKNRPETSDTQFEWKFFIEQNNNELLAKFGNFVNRVIKFVHAKFESTVPDYSKAIGQPEFETWTKTFDQALREYITDMEAVNLRDGCNKAMHIAQLGNEFLQENKLDNKLAAEQPERAAAVVGMALNLIHLLSSVFAPFLPASSRSILRQLNAPFLVIPDKWSPSDLKPGHTIGKAEYLFTKIDPKKEDEWREQFGGTQEERNKRKEELALKEAQKKAKKEAEKAKKAAKKAAAAAAKPEEAKSVETQGSKPIADGKDPVEKVVDGTQQMTLPSS